MDNFVLGRILGTVWLWHKEKGYADVKVILGDSRTTANPSSKISEPEVFQFSHVMSVVCVG